MKKYIHMGQVLTYPKDISESVEVSTDYNEQQSKYVELSAAQSAFHEANQTATVREVWEMVLSVPEAIAPSKLRELAYASEAVIMWDGEMRTCDFCRGVLFSYELTENTTRHAELKALWMAARTEIQERYPD